MRKALLLVAVAWLSACATAPAPPSLTVHADVEELVESDSWRVTLGFSQPVSEVRFARDGRGPLRSGWTIVEPAGATWTKDEAIILAAPSDRVVIELETDPRDREKDYNLNLTFTDGSRLLYTGHLAVADVEEQSWMFRAPENRDIHMIDSLVDMGDTYVYFGSIRPVEHERMTLIVDPGLPPWIERQMRELAPKQLDYFAAKLGTPLDFKPLVLLSYVGDQSPGLSFKGGTLPGLVQIALDGKGWTTESPQASEMWFSRLAHEIFHLWNGQMFQHDEQSEWLSEASADMAALRAMRDLGVISEDRERELIVEAANECIVRLEGKPIVQANPRNYYACGLLTQLLAGDDIWPVYRKTLREDYTTADFLRNAENAAAIEQFALRGPVGATDVYVESLLREAGIDVIRVAPEQATVPHGVLRWMLVSTVRRCACRTQAPQCNSLGRVETIGAIDSRREPARAHAALLAGERVTIDGKATDLSCGAEDADPNYSSLLGLNRRTPRSE